MANEDRNYFMTVDEKDLPHGFKSIRYFKSVSYSGIEEEYLTAEARNPQTINDASKANDYIEFDIKAVTSGVPYYDETGFHMTTKDAINLSSTQDVSVRNAMLESIAYGSADISKDNQSTQGARRVRTYGNLFDDDDEDEAADVSSDFKAEPLRIQLCKKKPKQGKNEEPVYGLADCTARLAPQKENPNKWIMKVEAVKDGSFTAYSEEENRQIVDAYAKMNADLSVRKQQAASANPGKTVKSAQSAEKQETHRTARQSEELDISLIQNFGFKKDRYGKDYMCMILKDGTMASISTNYGCEDLIAPDGHMVKHRQDGMPAFTQQNPDLHKIANQLARTMFDPNEPGVPVSGFPMEKDRPDKQAGYYSMNLRLSPGQNGHARLIGTDVQFDGPLSEEAQKAVRIKDIAARRLAENGKSLDERTGYVQEYFQKVQENVMAGKDKLLNHGLQQLEQLRDDSAKAGKVVLVLPPQCSTFAKLEQDILSKKPKQGSRNDNYGVTAMYFRQSIDKDENGRPDPNAHDNHFYMTEHSAQVGRYDYALKKENEPVYDINGNPLTYVQRVGNRRDMIPDRAPVGIPKNVLLHMIDEVKKNNPEYMHLPFDEISYTTNPENPEKLKPQTIKAYAISVDIGNDGLEKRIKPFGVPIMDNNRQIMTRMNEYGMSVPLYKTVQSQNYEVKPHASMTYVPDESPLEAMAVCKQMQVVAQEIIKAKRGQYGHSVHMDITPNSNPIKSNIAGRPQMSAGQESTDRQWDERQNMEQADMQSSHTDNTEQKNKLAIDGAAFGKMFAQQDSASGTVRSGSPEVQPATHELSEAFLKEMKAEGKKEQSAGEDNRYDEILIQRTGEPADRINPNQDIFDATRQSLNVPADATASGASFNK